MPYRRLPNTNQARLRSLQQAVNMGDYVDLYDLAFSYKNWEDAKTMLVRYERALFESKQCSDNQFKTSKQLQETAKMTRLYVSHFIQVLNMCVQRNEIKAEYKELYGLDPSNFTVPDINTDDGLIEWGRRIIDGEQKRLSKGGTPIYNPAIAKVRVHYDIFVEGYNNQKILQNNTSRSIENVAEINKEVDKLILNIWDEVEKKFEDLSPQEKLKRCKEYGLIYYYRKGEVVPDEADQ